MVEWLLNSFITAYNLTKKPSSKAQMWQVFEEISVNLDDYIKERDSYKEGEGEW